MRANYSLLSRIKTKMSIGDNLNKVVYENRANHFFTQSSGKNSVFLSVLKVQTMEKHLLGLKKNYGEINNDNDGLYPYTQKNFQKDRGPVYPET